MESHLLAIHRVHPYFGCLRMAVAFGREGLMVNYKKVYGLMKLLEICSVIRKKRRCFGKQASVVNPNRLERQFKRVNHELSWLQTSPIFALENGLCISLLFRI
ncbi:MULTISPECIES: IS3 family transposase [Paenibacillus]|uniref:IS3 family transposase n=1 Tax=Paenibacillus TaxID=44249 RepID=UPI003F4FF47D